MSRHAARISRSIGSSDPGSMPRAVAAASIGEPSRAQRAALDRTRVRYGLEMPPSPSSARQTGSSASWSARRCAASGSIDSRPRTLTRSITSEPTRTSFPASPNTRKVRRRSSATSAASTSGPPASASPATHSHESIHSSADSIEATIGRSSVVQSPSRPARAAANARRCRPKSRSSSATSSPRCRATMSAPKASANARYERSKSSNCDTADIPGAYEPPARADGARWHHPGMHLHFLGGATTVSGSQFLLDTGRAKVLIDCGMFQGSPNEVVRNRVPFAFEPSELDTVVITHAHLDHCGLLPVLVREGYGGPIHVTDGTAELARLVLLDSGKLHEQFAKREERWERRNPDKVEADDRAERDAYDAAVALAEEGNAIPSEATAMATNRDAVDPEAALRAQ